MIPRQYWTQSEIELLRERYADTVTSELVECLGHSVTSIYNKAFSLNLKKSAAFHNSQSSGRLLSGDKRGLSSRFPKGHVPANKGVKGWQAGGRSAETQFKPGHRGGRAAELYQPIGTERITKDGYSQRKVNDDMPLQRRWKAVHVIVWEEHHGPVPKNHIVIFKSPDKLDTSIGNLEMISRAENMRRNTIHRYPPELKSTIRLAGKLERKINEKQD